MLSDRNIVQYSQHFQTYILHLPVLSNSHRSPGIEPPWPDQGHKSIPESVTVDLGTECADGHSGSCADPRSWPPAGRGGWGHHAHRLSPASLSPTQTWALGTPGRPRVVLLAVLRLGCRSQVAGGSLPHLLSLFSSHQACVPDPLK